MSGTDLAHAAEALVGTPYRLHGRDRQAGLDCVGVVTAALAACGRLRRAPAGYGLRNRSIGPLLALAEYNGLEPAEGSVEPGDVLLVRPGAGQHHLLIATADGHFIHAHAGLRRVVAQPGPLPWPIEGRWRLAHEES